MSQPYEKEFQELTNENHQLKEQVRVLKKRKKYGLVWETREENPNRQENVVLQCQKELPVLKEIQSKGIFTDMNAVTHILIEGDNYHALSSLYYTHKNKVDVIYIDPPYNTGNKSRKYNNDYVEQDDEFKHSKRLNLMSVRLKIAKDLLKKDGVLICAIDENEHSTLGLLLSEIFGKYKIDCISIVHNPRGIQGNNFSYCNEYAFFVYPNNGKTYVGNMDRSEVIIEELRDHGGESLRTDAKNCFYPILVKDNKMIGVGDVPVDSFHPKGKNTILKDGTIQIRPIDNKGIERKRVFAVNTIASIWDKLEVRKKKNGEYDIRRTKDEQKPRTVWVDPRYDASTWGSKIVKQITGQDFPFPKSLYTVKDCLNLLIGKNKNAVVLDFFSGSGTTAHAVMEMNNDDNGSRQSISVTNNEIGYKEEMSFRKKYNIEDTTLADWKKESNKKRLDYCEKYGICSSVTYPRIRNVIKGYAYVGNKKDILFEEKITVSKLSKMDQYLETMKDLKNKNIGKYDEIKTTFKDQTLQLEGVKSIAQTMPGMGGNLKYYVTDFVENKATDKARRQLVSRSVEMLCLVEKTFDAIQHNEYCAIYATYDKTLLTVIIFDEGKVEEVLSKILKFTTAKITIYQFTYNEHINVAPYENKLSNYELKAVPDSLLRSYQTVFKKTLKILSNQ